jgi:hypothetical protein
MFAAAFALAIGAAMAQDTGGHPPREMTEQEKVDSWKGEKVMLIGNEPGQGSQNIVWGGARCSNCKDGIGPCYRRYEKPDEGLPNDAYAGKTGHVLETRFFEPSPPEPRYEVVVELDGSGEKIVACSLEALGFFAERDAGMKLAGKMLWAKGQMKLARVTDLQKDRSKLERIQVKNTQQLTVTRAEWGWPTQTVVICFRTETNEEGCMDGWDGRYSIDDRFHMVPLTADPYSNSVYEQSPRKLHPRWGKAIWEAIANEEIAIGMTEEMAKVACGKDLVKSGLILDMSHPDESSPIYTCPENRTRFLVRKGVVSKYVEAR